jgi:uncharacterized protein (DUF2235 family)
MPKNIIVFSDGTGQDGGVRPEQRISNIYKLYWTSRNHPNNAIAPHDQVAFYDAGLGTDIGATAVTAPVRFVQKLLGSIAGEGIKRNIADCYEFIINHYQPGDRIFLFGFSRGAYTVRCISNLLMLCGVPTKTPSGPVMRFRKAIRDIAGEAVDSVLEHGAGHPRANYEAERLELARRFQVKYGSGDGSESNASPYFVGVFDTVAALGASGLRRTIIHAALGAGVAIGGALVSFLPAVALAAALKEAWHNGFWSTFWMILALGILAIEVVFWYKQKASKRKTIRDFPNKGDVSTHVAEWKGANFDRLLSRHVGYARSANAIDETRKDFDRVPWGPIVESGSDHADDQMDFVQMWFAGNHSDVGGSYPEPESRLSDVALAWMAEEATKVPNGLKTGPIFANGNKIPNTGDAGECLHVYPSADGVQHCEIAGMRDTLDSYAAKAPKWLKGLITRGGWEVKVRNIDPKAPIDRTVEQRFALPSVIQCAGTGPYRPRALKDHDKFKSLYPADGPGSSGARAEDGATL